MIKTNIIWGSISLKSCMHNIQLGKSWAKLYLGVWCKSQKRPLIHEIDEEPEKKLTQWDVLESLESNMFWNCSNSMHLFTLSQPKHRGSMAQDGGCSQIGAQRSAAGLMARTWLPSLGCPTQGTGLPPPHSLSPCPFPAFPCAQKPRIRLSQIILSIYKAG